MRAQILSRGKSVRGCRSQCSTTRLQKEYISNHLPPALMLMGENSGYIFLQDEVYGI